jgi:hypothetical protein
MEHIAQVATPPELPLDQESSQIDFACQDEIGLQ